MVNRVSLCGKLTTKPIAHGKMCHFYVSVADEQTDKKQLPNTLNHHVVLLGRVAEFFQAQTVVGDTVLLDGRLGPYSIPGASREYLTIGTHFVIIGYSAKQSTAERASKQLELFPKVLL